VARAALVDNVNNSRMENNKSHFDYAFAALVLLALSSFANYI